MTIFACFVLIAVLLSGCFESKEVVQDAVEIVKGIEHFEGLLEQTPSPPEVTPLPRELTDEEFARQQSEITPAPREPTDEEFARQQSENYINSVF